MEARHIANTRTLAALAMSAVMLSSCGAGSNGETATGSQPLPGSSSTSTNLVADTTSSSAPAPESGTVEGIIVAVDGTIADIASFTVRLPDGSNVSFVPEPGILFDGTAPIDHVRDHLASGAPVRVVYTTIDDGTLSAVEVGDA